MTTEAFIFTALSSHPGLHALIAARIYPQQMPQGAVLPNVTYTLISGPTDAAINGRPVSAEKRYQLTAFAAAYDTVLAVVEQLLAAVRSISDSTIKSVLVDNQIDLFDPETHVHYRAIDVILLDTGVAI